MNQKYGTLTYSLSDFEHYDIDVSDEVIPISEPVQEKPKRSRDVFALIVSIVILATVSLFGFDNTNFSKKISSMFSSLEVIFDDTDIIAGKSSSELYFKASNEYGVYETKYPWFDDYKGSQLVEPYKNTTMTAHGTMTRNAQIYWKFPDLGLNFTGETISHIFEQTGMFSVHIEAVEEATGKLRGRIQTYVISKYVKRELRSLTEADREKFLDAAATLWKYSTVEGRKLFGDKYTSTAELVEEHALASNDIRCDGFHEGSGFLTHHLAITQSFEAALRSVDPSVTLPYWDFTIEGQQIYDYGKSPSYFLEITPFLNDEWFGSVDENDHIQDSRWAHIEMPRVSNTSVVAPNSYGYIRSYWNNNNDEEVNRHLFDVCGIEITNKEVPNCNSHYSILDTEDLAALQLLSPSDGHGPMHVFLGGIRGDMEEGCIEGYAAFEEKWKDVLDANITEDEVINAGYQNGWSYGLIAPRRKMIEKQIFGEYFHIYRTLWRSHMCALDNTPNLLQCPESCDISVSVTECKCEVPGIANSTEIWKNIYPCVLSSKSREQFEVFFPEEMIKDVVVMVATSSLVEGEMLEAASPADPTFWVIHPTIDRLLSAKRLTTITDMNGVEFQKWASVDGSGEEWLSYSYYTQDAGENLYFPDAYTCVGHAADDRVLPDRLQYLDGFIELADKDQDGKISNWEYFLAIDPNNVRGVDYVYDNFDWKHCNIDASVLG